MYCVRPSFRRIAEVETDAPERALVIHDCPPTPYMYADTMAWLKRADLPSVLVGAMWVPKIECFDLDVARSSWQGCSLSGDDGAAALSAAKCVNKWLFFQLLQPTNS